MSGESELRTREPLKMTFGMLAQQVLALDAAIEWVALEEAGREPRWAWRNSHNGNLYTGTTAHGGRIVDPFLLMLADQATGLRAEDAIDDPRRVLFVVLAYCDCMQVVAYLRPDAHLVVALSAGTDPYVLGKKIASLLYRSTERTILQ